LEASAVSAASFSLGALVPVLVVLAATRATRVPAMVVATLLGLGALGVVGARLGGAPPTRPALRVLVGGALALAIAAGVGHLFHANVA
jgi:VIT1/CCC1 family predicted Fe2+/Mn2+ transporter